MVSITIIDWRVVHPNTVWTESDLQCPQNAAQYWCEKGLAHMLVEFSMRQSTPGRSWHMPAMRKRKQ